MDNPRIVNTIEVTNDGTIWIDIIEIKRGLTQIIGKQVYLCQGDRNNPTEFFISKFDIDRVISALQEVKKEFDT